MALDYHTMSFSSNSIRYSWLWVFGSNNWSTRGDTYGRHYFISSSNNWSTREDLYGRLYFWHNCQNWSTFGGPYIRLYFWQKFNSWLTRGCLGLRLVTNVPCMKFFLEKFAPDLSDLCLSDFGLGLIGLANSDSESDPPSLVIIVLISRECVWETVTRFFIRISIRSKLELGYHASMKRFNLCFLPSFSFANNWRISSSNIMVLSLAIDGNAHQYRILISIVGKKNENYVEFYFRMGTVLFLWFSHFSELITPAPFSKFFISILEKNK